MPSDAVKKTDGIVVKRMFLLPEQLVQVCRNPFSEARVDKMSVVCAWRSLLSMRGRSASRCCRSGGRKNLEPRT